MATWVPASRGVDEISCRASRAGCLEVFLLVHPSVGGLGARDPWGSQAWHQFLQSPLLPLDGSIGERELNGEAGRGLGQAGWAKAGYGALQSPGPPHLPSVCEQNTEGCGVGEEIS